MNILELWGSSEELTPLQMAIRAFCSFLLALIMIRLGGMQMFGKKSALDSVVVIILGAVMARGIVGASPFLSVVGASATIVFTNWIFSRFCQSNHFINRIMKGTSVVLFEFGEINSANLRRNNLSKSDLLESLRLETNHEDWESISKIYLETNGRISIVLKDKKLPSNKFQKSEKCVFKAGDDPYLKNGEHSGHS